MTNKTWRQRWLEPLAHLLRGETPSARPSTRRPRFVPHLEALEARLAPATTFSIADNSVLEPAPGGTVNLDFTVTRTGDLTSQVTLGYTTVAGTAKANTDFTPTTGTTTFASGSATAVIAIPVFGNGVFDNPSLTFSVQLTGVTNVVGPPVTLAARSDFTTGTSPFFVAVGDLNGDGKPDLVVANYSSGNVSVLLNTTAPGAAVPSFATQQTFATGVHPRSVALGDVNGDGKPDLVVANDGAASVSVLLNTTTPGSSTAAFAAQQTFATGANPRSVTLGDVNGDGLPDLIVANDGANTVSVLLNTTMPGNPTASFAAQQTFATGSGPFSIAFGDVNGDGLPDLIVANFGGGGGNTVSVLLNTTTPGSSMASFATQQTFATGTGAISVALGDVNGDGKRDLIVANWMDKTVSVLLNTTTTGAFTASFAAQQTFATGDRPFSVAVGDLNGDGKPDLIVANESDATASVLRNTTTPGASMASFDFQHVFATGITPVYVAVADFNGDGKPDIAVANYSSANVSVLLNTTVIGAAAIVPDFPQAAKPAVGKGPNSVAVADLNGDGKPDLIFANSNAATASVLLNTTTPGASTPTFAAEQTFATGSGSVSLAVADVNGDGRPDVIVANITTATVSVLVNTTTPGATTASFAAQQSFTTGAQPFFVAVGDVNGDGKPDVIVTNRNTNTVSVLLNTTTPGTSTASFASPQTFATGSFPFSVALGDVNGDGRPDLIVTNQNDKTVSVLLNTTLPGATTPSFATQQTFATGARPEPVVVGDVNGDGMPDLIVGNYNDKTVSVLLNTTLPGATTASFATQQTFAAGKNPYSLALGDVNGDGKPDLLVTNSIDGTVSVLLNTTTPGASTPTFAAQKTFTVGYEPLSVALGDVNGDGRPDLLVANYGDNTASVLLNTPETITTATATGTITESDSQSTPTVQFSTASQSVNETDGTFTVTVTLSAVSTSDVTVPFTLGGTAVSGTDYSGVTASPLVIKAGQLSGTITGTLIDDGKFNTTNKTLTLTLGTPTNATVGANGADTLTITESDPKPTVSFASATQNVNENAGTFTVTVNLSAASSVDTTIPFTLGGTAVSGTDYSGVTMSPLVITAGQLSGTITGNLIDDGKFNTTNKTLTLTLGTPTNATVGANGADTLTINESDPKPTVSFAAATQNVNENGGTFTVTVNLSAASLVDTTIPFTLGGTAVSGTDYSGVTMSPLVITAGQLSGTITGNLIDDGLFSTTNKTLTLTLGSPTNATVGANGADTVTINESDPKPTVSFASATQSVNENGGTFTVKVNLSAPSSVDTTIPFTLGGTAVSGTDYSGVTASPLVIKAGQITGAIKGTLIDDGKFNTTNKTLTLTLGAPTNATVGANGADTLTISESDPKPTVSFASATQTVNETDGAFTVTVTLSAASGVATMVPFTLGGAAVNGVDYSGVTASPLVIAAGQTSGTISGTLIDDGAPDAVKTLTLTLGAPTNATLGATTTDTLTIADSPPPPPQQSLPPFVSVAFGPFGEVLELVNSAGVLTQFDAFGAHVLGGGVRSASVAFGPFGEVLEVVGMNGILTQFDASGAHQLGGAGVESASVAFGPGGEVLEVVLIDGSLRQFSAAGVQLLATSGVVSASVAFGPGGEVVDIVSTGGALTQFDATGAHQLGAAGVQSAGVALTSFGEVLDIIFSDGSLDQFDAFGVHRLGVVS